MDRHFSWSQVNLYLRNPREYWFQYIYKPTHEKAGAFHFDIGTAYHKAIEDLYLGSSLMDVQESFELDLSESAKNHYQLAEVAAMKNAITEYYNTIFPLYGSLKENVEESRDDYYLPEIDIPFHYRIDLTLVDGGIVDHKTVGANAYKSEFGIPKAKNNFQLLIYAYIKWQQTGVVPRYVELHRAYKSPYNAVVDVDRWEIRQVDMLNALNLVQNVYKSIQNKIFYSTGKWYNEEFAEEWDLMLERRSIPDVEF